MVSFIRLYLQLQSTDTGQLSDIILFLPPNSVHLPTARFNPMAPYRIIRTLATGDMPHPASISSCRTTKTHTQPLTSLFILLPCHVGTWSEFVMETETRDNPAPSPAAKATHWGDWAARTQEQRANPHSLISWFLLIAPSPYMSTPRSPPNEIPCSAYSRIYNHELGWEIDVRNQDPLTLPKARSKLHMLQTCQLLHLHIPGPSCHMEFTIFSGTAQQK